jgi:tripartite-type tricarboxylate transporter receptor subunit TctC
MGVSELQADIPVLPDYGYSTEPAWLVNYGIWAPRGISDDVRLKIRGAILNAVADPVFQRFLTTNLWSDASHLDGAQLQQDYVDFWDEEGEILKASGLHISQTGG